MQLLIKCFFLVLVFFSIGLVQVFILIKTIDNGSQVVIRDLLFTEVYTEHELDSLHKKLDEINYSNYSEEDLKNIYNDFPQDLKKIIEFSINTLSSQHQKVTYIINHFSPSFNMDSQQCMISDISSTTRKIFEAGLGCCSDYAKSAVTILASIGIKSREINNNRHTSIEYFNSHTNSWVWIDTSYRLYSINEEGELQSAEEIFLSRYSEIKYVEFGLKNLTQFTSFKINKFHKPNQNNALFYSLESLDPPLRDRFIELGINPAITEIIFHVTNMRQGKIVLMPYGFQSIIFSFAKYSAFLFILLGVMLNLIMSFLISMKISNFIYNTYWKKT
jgi:hypothetical protein